MSTIITFDLKELKKLANDKNSCVKEKKVTQNIALQPWCLGNIKESIKNQLDYKVGKFDKEFSGILLSYKNLRILQNVGSIRNDNADIHFQVQADYFIFKPYVGATLKGVVNKKSPTHLGILVHRVFNVVIPRPTEEPGNKWIGESIEEGQKVVFRIVVLDLFGALPYIRGELDERWCAMGPDGDDILDDPNQPISVSYINFDKTNPIQKQSEDGVPNSSQSNKHPIESDTPNKNQSKNFSAEHVEINCITSPSKCETENNGVDLTETVKSKKDNKVSEGETKQAEVCRKPKRRKKDS